MALQKDFNFRGLLIKNSYIKILKIEGDKNYLSLQIGIFANKNENDYIESKMYYFRPSIEDSASNFYKQGYEYLKSLEDFKGSIDILEDNQIL